MQRDHVPPAPASAAGFGRQLLRAARLRCPACGRGKVVASWFRMKPRCPACGVPVARESDDLTLGAMMFNIVLSEGVLALILVGTMVATWPDVPWGALQYAIPALMVLAPFFFVPFSRTIWMAVDLMLHPVRPGGAERDPADPVWKPR